MGRQPAEHLRRSRLRGCAEPRLFTEPLRRLDRKTTLGYEFIDFCDMIGEPLLPWQKWLSVHVLELTPDGFLRFALVLVLVARQNGKTTWKRLVSLWRLYIVGARLVAGLAQDLDLAREVWQQCIDTIESTPDLKAELDLVRRTNGNEYFRLTSGGRYMIKASNRKATRGLSIDELNVDELRELRDWAAWGAISKTVMARPNAQIVAMSNAGDDESVVLNGLRDAALSGRDPRTGIFEWSAPDNCDLDDVVAWAQANPSLGYTIAESAIRTALATDPPEVFRTEVLCQRVEALDSAVDLPAWRDCRDTYGTLDDYRDRILACVEVGMAGHVTLTAGAVMADGRVRVEAVQAWESTESARPELDAVLDRVDARAEAWFPSGPAAALAPVLRARENSVEITGQAVAEACQSLADLVRARRIVHPGDPLLDAHIAASSKYWQGDSWRFARRGGAGNIDAAYAVAGVVHVALTLPEPEKLPRPMVV